MEGVVYDIQTHAIYDGPGVRTCVHLKGCPLRCAWCHNPESWEAAPQLMGWADRCTGCGACVDACPFGMATLHPESGLALICDLCGGDPACVKRCATGAIRYERAGAVAQEKREMASRRADGA